ncbi:MAG: peptidase domain-containing ABC transporter [Salinivirgaceae bacterium]|nr:peptidase domain-containing ABC transporter [Salinivirgaceae bacterium]
MSKFPFYKQLDAMDCGPTCLKMVAEFYGKKYSLQNLRAKSYITRAGVSMLGISDAAEAIGFRSMGVKASLEKLVEEDPVPFIAHWKQEHFVVVYKLSKTHVFVSDPAHGHVKYTHDEFAKQWASSKQDGENVGVALLLEPAPDFYEKDDEKHDRTSFAFLLQYLRPHKKFLVQLALGMLLGSLLQLIFPFLTQSVVDIGINTQNLNFVYLVLIAQLVLFIARMVTDFIRGWILLHISTRVNISLISDFLIKLMKLPVGFFDTKLIGDLMQRIGDHQRIESFLTSETLNILFSLFNLVIFGAVLAFYSWAIFFVFLVGSLLYIGWILLFMKKRRELDFKRFQQASDNQSNLYQLITGMQEIKLNNCEKQKRWEWERIQAKLFKVSIKGLALSQYQQAGSVFFNEGKNILISIIAATSVISGDMTLGMMMAVQYIIGQLNSPIAQMITFMQSMQDAKISLERLGEIHEKDDEEDVDQPKLMELPEQKDIQIKDLMFQYEGPHSPKVLDNINLEIPQNKVTAIVGASGSGKTTLLKLMLGFYPPVQGKINVGKTGLENFSQRMWRDKCGVVMQDGFIFSDGIAKNIAVSDEIVDRQKLLEAVKVANIQEFVEELPLSYNTKIGQEGSGISQGQKQRMLIARAVYKNPEYIFLDEATNALDANNEKVIMENLQEFFKGRTVVVVAHRLSTVKNADQIVVLEKGKIVEVGNHKELAAKKGAYYELVKNQLELGN